MVTFTVCGGMRNGIDGISHEQRLSGAEYGCSHIMRTWDLSFRADYVRKKEIHSAAVQELYNEVVGSDPSARDEFEQELVNIEVAQLIHDMRTGAPASVINRLESDDYQGHTIAMVRRIATALNRRLELRAVPVRRRSVKTRAGV